MTKAIFSVQISHEQTLPYMSDLQWNDATGVLHGGWSCVGNTSNQTETQLVLVETTPEMLNTMAESTDYLFVGDVAEVP